MRGNQSYRNSLYIKQAEKILPELISANKGASNELLLKLLKLKTVVPVPNYVKPDNIDTLCRQVLYDDAIKKAQLILPTSNLHLPNNSELGKAKKFKSSTDNTNEIELQLTVKSLDKIHSTERYYGNTDTLNAVKNTVVSFSKTLVAELFNSAILVTGPNCSGKKTLVYKALSDANSFLTNDTFVMPTVMEINCKDILVQLMNPQHNPESIFTALSSQVVSNLISPAILLITDLDLLISEGLQKPSGNNTEARKSKLLVSCFSNFLSTIFSNFSKVLIIITTDQIQIISHCFQSNTNIAAVPYEMLSLTNLERTSMFMDYLELYSTKSVKIDAFDLDYIVSLTEGWYGSRIIKIVNTAVMLATSHVDFGKVHNEHNFAMTDSSDCMNDDRLSVDKSIQNNYSTLASNNSSKLVECSCLIKLIKADLDKAVEHGANISRDQCFAAIPKTSMDDIGGLDSIIEYVKEHFIDGIIHHSTYKEIGLQESSGLLLYGPPGCGKTLLAKAIANHCHTRFISVNGSELLEKYVGDSEKRVNEIFAKARNNTPCIIFFDEFDALCPSRDAEGINEVSRRIVNMILTELDGVNNRSGIFVVAATNREKLIDKAILRSGRFEHKIFLPPPDEIARGKIIEVITRSKKWQISKSDVDVIARTIENYSGADIMFILSQAAAKYWRNNKHNFTKVVLTAELVLSFYVPKETDY